MECDFGMHQYLMGLIIVLLTGGIATIAHLLNTVNSLRFQLDIERGES